MKAVGIEGQGIRFNINKSGVRKARLWIGLVAIGAVLIGATTTLRAQTNYQRLFTFGPYPATGTSPRARLLEASDGWLYGTTYAGGSNNLGTLFRIARNGGGFATLVNFSGPDLPYGGLVLGTNGALYGTTSGGGSLNGGAVFKFTPSDGQLAIIHNFALANKDGVAPVSSLIQADDGMFYGTCSGGGATNLGTVYQVSADGAVYHVLRDFLGRTNGNDGANPAAALVQARDGRLYGTTQAGGSADLGTVFRLNRQGTAYTVLHQFAGPPSDGRMPLSELVQGPDVLLYGTTAYGGANDVGTIYRVDTNGNNYAVVKSFTTTSGGYQPLAGLAGGPDGALYGTTRYGGPNDSGTAFRFNPADSAYSVVHNFSTGGGDGAQPFAALVLGSDGAWYGTTFYGGDRSLGVVFRLFSGAAPVTITSISNAPAGVMLNFAGGAAGQAYAIQATASLAPVSWQSLGTNTAGIDGRFQYIDAAGATAPSRFYRTAQP